MAPEEKEITDMRLTQEERQFALSMYEEHAEHCRLHEELRASATSLLMTLVGGLLAASVFAQAHSRILGLMIGVISLLGVLLNWKHYERFCLHRHVLRGFLDQLQQGLSASVATLNERRRKEHEASHPILSGIRLNWLWSLSYAITLSIGLYFKVRH